MPQKGTKKVVINGQEEFRPEEIVTLSEVIALGVAAQEEVDAAKAKLDLIRERFIALVEPKRAGRASVRIDGLHGGSGLATWSTEKKIAQDVVVQLEQRMNAAGRPELFAGLFESERVFRFTRSYRNFLRAAGRALDPFLSDIALAIEVKAKNPSVKFTADAEAAQLEVADA